MNENKSEYVGRGRGKMMDEARTAAIVLGIEEGVDWNYNNLDLYTIVSDRGAGSYAGIAQVGGRKNHHQKGYTSLRTAVHEFAHNQGLSHAHFNYTSDLNPRGSIPTNGLGRVEYGHRFSVMSAQFGSDETCQRIVLHSHSIHHQPGTYLLEMEALDSGPTDEV